jgi:L-threonylcarbamoyladenylate synthase
VPKSKASARIYRGTERNITFLAGRLQAGELVAVPTETVYGLGANALDAKACTAIFRAKRRPTTDPLIVHLYRRAQLDAVCVPNAATFKLAKAFWPGALTLVLPKQPAIPDIVTAGRPSVAVRMPRHPLFRRLLKAADLPIAAPSANPFGYVSPTTAAHVHASLGARIRYILDGGPATIGLESTILDLRDERGPRLLRPGAITREAIESVLGRSILVPRVATKGKTADAQVAPGLLERHYSPRTPVILHKTIQRFPRPDEAYVCLRRPFDGRVPANVYWLDRHGNLRGAARRLFSTLREVDGAGYGAIHVELASGSGLADAINDRLRRAAAR